MRDEREILTALRQRFKGWIKLEIWSVIIFQNHEAVYLEINSLDNNDEPTKKTIKLDFIVEADYDYEKNAPLTFAPEYGIERNADKFLALFDYSLIIIASELFTQDAINEIEKNSRQPVEVKKNVPTTIIKANTKEFAKAITIIGKTIPALRKMGNVKVSVLPNDITIYAPGIEQTVKAETEGYTDMMVPFRLLYGIAKTDKRETITLTIKEGEIDCGGYTLASSLLKFNTVFSKGEIDLPINPTKLDILKLSAIYTLAQLREYKMMPEIQAVERQLENALLQALIHLEPYGISKKDLDEMIDKKITERL